MAEPQADNERVPAELHGVKADLHRDLDDATADCLVALQKYLDMQIILGDAFKRGCLHLAKARRANNLPGGFVTLFPATMEPSTSVVELDEGVVEIAVRRGLVPDAHDGKSPRVDPPEVGGPLSAAQPVDGAFGSLRGNVCTFEDVHGHGHVSAIQSSVSLAPGDMSTVKAATFAALVTSGAAEERATSALDPAVVDAQRVRKPPLQNDPLKWFGILVPADLRHAQNVYDRVLPVLAEFITAARQLERAEGKVRDLRAELDTVGTA